jgi:hypothetical protein
VPDAVAVGEPRVAVTARETHSRSGAAVSIDRVAKRYGDVVALRPTTLEIAAGEFF